jgi:hypothetical protein
VTCNFQTGNNKIKLLTEYKIVTQNIFLAMQYSPHWCLGENMTSYLEMATVQAKAMCVLWFSETKSVIHQNVTSLQNSICKISTFRCFYSTLVSNFKRLVMFCTENMQEDIDRIQEAFSRKPQKSTRRAFLQLHIPQTNVWKGCW